MQERLFKHTVPLGIVERQRLSKYIIGVFPFLETGSAVKKAIKKNEIQINGRIGESGDWVKVGDILEYRTSFVKPASINPLINVVHEDKHLLIINKPPGLLSSGETSKSLQNILKSYPSSQENGALFYPYLIHRLDRQTCGLIIGARTIEARRKLGSMIENHKIVKEYSVIVEGHINHKGQFITTPIDQKKAKTEILDVRLLPTKDPSSFVRVGLHTGRTHQIRRHFLSEGHPVVGDDIYNKEGLSFGRGLFLMADHLEFIHPITKERIALDVKLHDKFLKYL